MKIAHYEVTDVTQEKAQVGCTTVTRAQVEALLEAMKTGEPDIKITKAVHRDSRFVMFTINLRHSGAIAASRAKNATYENIHSQSSDGFGNYSAAFCFEKEKAEVLYQFLKTELGY